MTKRSFKVAACVLGAVSVLTACSKKEESAEAAPAEPTADASAGARPTASAPAEGALPAEILPGQNAVRSALKAKNYSAAVTQLMEMKKGLPNEMWSDYSSFYGEVENTLISAAEKDPNAAQALALLRALTAGR